MENSTHPDIPVRACVMVPIASRLVHSGVYLNAIVVDFANFIGKTNWFHPGNMAPHSLTAHSSFVPTKTKTLISLSYSNKGCWLSQTTVTWSYEKIFVRIF